MNQRLHTPPGASDPQDATNQALVSWLRERAPTATPPTLMAGVRSRVPATQRRRRWQIRDWWSWRSGRGDGPSYLVAAATGALSIAVLSVTGVGVLMVANISDPDPLLGGPAGQAETTAAAATAATVEAPEEPATVVVPATSGVPSVDTTTPEAQVTKVVGAILEVPTIVDKGERRVPRSGVVDVFGLQTEAAVEFVDDSRLSGTQQLVLNERRYDGGGSVATGTLAIDNEAGSWAGTLVGATPPGRGGSIMQAELVGSGDYTGLSATIRYDLGLNWGDPAMILGIVYPGSALEDPEPKSFERFAELPGAISPIPLGEPGSVEMSRAPAPVTGSIVGVEVLTGDNSFFDDTDQTIPIRDELMWFDLALDDSRLTINETEAIVKLDHFLPPEGGSLLAAAIRARNDDGGGWSGSMRGFGDPAEPPFEAEYNLLELTGEGAYDGVSAILFSTPDPLTERDEFGSGSWSVEGILFPDQVLPYPEGT
jgi:hypothetical protein